MKLGSDLLWLSEKDVASLLTMKEVLSVIEEAFRAHGENKIQMPAKLYLDFHPDFDGDLRAMPAFLKGKTPAAGVKIVNSHPQNPARGLPAVSGVMMLADPETGLPVAVFSAGTLTSLRTGAGGGVAAKYLARKNSEVVGLVGSGRQAATQLEALSLLFSIKKVRVWGKTKEDAQVFLKQTQPAYRFEFEICDHVKNACEADIVVTTTPVRSPLVQAAWIRPGTHINAIGADAPGKQELETALVLKSRVVVDEWAQASHAGEINVPVSEGRLSKENTVGQLGEIVTGKKQGRLSDSDITIFDSTGLALQDVAVGKMVYDKASKSRKGQVLNFNG